MARDSTTSLYSPGGTPRVFEGLYYEEYGAGPPVIALHGFGMTGYSWRHLIGPLAQTNRLFIVDLIGHGLSTKSRQSGWSLQDQADMIVRLITTIAEKDIVLVGHSIGGAIALLIAMTLSASQNSSIRALVLIDSVALPQRLPFFVRAIRFPPISTYIVRSLPTNWVVRFLLAQAYYDRSKITKDQVAAYAVNLRSLEAVRALSRMAQHIIPPDVTTITHRFVRITSDCLLLWGSEDKIVRPAIGIALNALLPRSTLLVFDECGHIPHEEIPTKAITEICRFIAAVRLR